MVNEQRQTQGEDWEQQGGGGDGDWQTPASEPNDLLQESARQPGEGRQSWGTGAGHETTGGGMTGGTGTGMTSGGGWSEGDDDGER